MPTLRLGLLALALALPACSLFSNEEEVRVAPYDGAPLTAADAQLFGEAFTWEARLDTNGDGLRRITLLLRQPDPVMWEEQYVIRLLETNGSLPAFEAAFFDQRVAAPEGGFTETRRGLRDGRVAIQDFDLGERVSGRTSGDLQFTFFYEFEGD